MSATSLIRATGSLTSCRRRVGISTVTRAGNDMVIYTDSGVTLFEKSARTISFNRPSPMMPARPAPAVFADGVPLTGAGASMGIKSGALHGHATLRDEVAPQYQLQLDEIAGGLVHAFGEPAPGGAAGSSSIPARPAPWSRGPYRRFSAMSIPPSAVISPACGDGVTVNFHPAGDAAFLRPDPRHAGGAGGNRRVSTRRRGSIPTRPCRASPPLP